MSSPHRMNAYRFLRPTLLVFGCYCLGLLIRYGASQPKPDEPIRTLLPTIEAIPRPHASRTPHEVVQLQVAGLSHPDQARGILQCMSFASPDNLSVTGPLDRFARMVRTGPYNELTMPERVLIGQPTFVDGNARVLVTLVNERKLKAFVWVLSKQSVAPFEGCWMTEGVFPLRLGQRREAWLDPGSDAT